MKLPKAMSEAEQKGQLSDSTASYQACNRSHTGFYRERKLHWKSPRMVLAKALSLHGINHLLNRQQNKEMIHSAFSICEFCKFSDFYIIFISSWQRLAYLDYFSSERILQPAICPLPSFINREGAWSVAEDWTGAIGSSKQNSDQSELQTVNPALKLTLFLKLWFLNLQLVMNLKHYQVVKRNTPPAVKRNIPPAVVPALRLDSSTGLSAAAIQTLGARFCNPLFEHQSEGVKVGQRKTCVIRSRDMVKKIHFPWKEPSFQTHSTRWAALSALLHVRWGFIFFFSESGAHSPHTACTTFSGWEKEVNPSLTETATHWIVLHYLRDSQEIFNKYITHCIKINIIYKTFIGFCSSSSYSVYKCAQYRWDLQRFAWIFPLKCILPLTVIIASNA